MTTPRLQFNPTPPHPNTLNNVLASFRELGYAIIPNVFVPETVDGFRKQVEDALVKDEHGWLLLPQDSPLRVWSAMAPVLRTYARGALSPAAMKPQCSLFECAWLNSPAMPDDPAKGGPIGWHKDRWHETYPASAGEYLYPDDVHLGMYFCDMTREHGPTYVIPRSHRDSRLSPHSGAEAAPFLARKQDVVLWDQRLWHSGSHRVAPGTRIFAIFGLFRVPVYDSTPHTMSPAQRNAWLAATNGDDRILLGGTFAPPGDEGGHSFR